MVCCRLTLRWLYPLIFLFGSAYGEAQTYTYPFDTGRAELPAILPTNNKLVQATYWLRNPTNGPVEVIIFLGLDAIQLYRIERGRRSLLGQAGWIYPAYRLQFTNYPEFGLQHRSGILFHLPPNQTIQVQAVFQNKTIAAINPVHPLLFSRAAYQHFLDHRQVERLQKRLPSMIFVGCLLIMVLYMGMQYIILRERVLLYYTLYVLLVLLRSIMTDDALHVMDGWPLLRSVGFVSRFSLTFMFWSFAAYGLFLHEYTGLNLRAPRIDRIYCTISGFFFLLGIGDIFVTVDKFVVPAWQLAHRLTDTGLLLFSIYTLFILWRFYDPITKFLFWGVTFLFASGAASIINRLFYGDSPLAYDREVAFFAIGYLLEILAFALGIAKRHELNRQEKLMVQAQLMDQLLENEQKQAKLNSLRDEIAYDLHDEMGSQLSSISILSQTTTRLVTDERARQRLNTIGTTARQAMDSMREIVWSLNSSSDTLQHVGLRIRETAYTLFNDSPVRLHIHIDDVTFSLGLTEKQRREIHLIAKECLTNIVRHANASLVTIHVEIQANGLQLTIKDDGVGFNSDICSSGLGLSSIRQRAERVNALLHIDSNGRDGTTIRLLCPFVTEKPISELQLEPISS